ncbi:MAG: hypothetical protein QOF76_1038, partial [Solirubrobacteraceae bacterium]|nr:hypothetical protein [Solirubrobacteraceae bacterium]
MLYSYPVGMDPRQVLGVSADANDEAIAVAYRKLAKRYHPDTAPGDEGAALRMAEINVAYSILRDTQLEMHKPNAKPAPRRPATPGAWLEPTVRRALGGELLAVLDPDEPILVVTDAATWESPRVRLAVSDRRLLWLNADAPTDRVRYLHFKAIATLDGRLKRPRRKVGELRVTPRHGRRLSFSELDPEA